MDVGTEDFDLDRVRRSGEVIDQVAENWKGARLVSASSAMSTLVTPKIYRLGMRMRPT